LIIKLYPLLVINLIKLEVANEDLLVIT